MNLLTLSAAMLAVTTIHYAYQMYAVRMHERHRRLRERVAYLLWVAANTHRQT